MGILRWLKRLRLDEEDFRDEIRAHLAMDADERIANGADPEAARYAALREFGNVTRTTEAARRVWTPRWIEVLQVQAGDVRYALRTLLKHPGFSVAVIGVLTLGIGLNAAVFTMLKGAALSPIAGVDGSARLLVIHGETTSGRQVRLSYPDYQHLRDHADAFSGLFGSIVGTANLGRGRAARHIWIEIVSGNYFQLLGVRAQQGRTLLPSDETAPGRHPVAVVSDGLWRRDYGADPDIVGRTIEINGQPLTVVGVAQPDFHGTTVVYDVEVFVPVTIAPQLGFTFGSQQTTPAGILDDRRATVFYPQGHLRSGATAASAAAQIEALWAALSPERPPDEATRRVKVVPFWQTPYGAPSFVLPSLIVLTAMGLLVLGIACANVAGLVLVRGVSRRGEIALRLALGATRSRVVRLLVVENLLLAMPGALLGVLLAQQVLPVLVSYAEWLAAPSRLHFNLEVDGLVLAFALLAAVGSALLFGFLPALRSSRVDLVSVINEDAAPRGAPRGRLRAGLVVAQVAVSLLLLIGAGLATRSLEAAQRANPGFDSAHVTAIAVDLRQNGYDAARGSAFYRTVLEALRAEPGIESASLAAYSPLGMTDTRVHRVAIEAYAARPGEDLTFMANVVGPDYFQTLRIPLMSGRPFAEADDAAAPPVAMVNTTLAQRFWGNAANAIGKRIRVDDGTWRTVIGVAADLKYARIDESPRPYVYLPFLQAYRPSMVLHTRRSADGVEAGPVAIDSLVERSRAIVAAHDPDLPILSARPLAEATRGAFIFYDLTATMLFLFGVAGMALAAMGTYGLIAYVVKQSTHEIGIRMALGASRCQVVQRFLARGLWLGALGAALGAAAALGAGQLLNRVLFGVNATDALSFGRALAIVLGTVLVAAAVPAWRAARMDPLRALRHY